MSGAREVTNIDEVTELDELIATLKRSNSPTLIVEGKDDYVAFREFEVENISWGLTIFPVKGVNNVRGILERVNEIRHPALAFLIDKDCAVFSHIPLPYARSDTFYTDGYSIENDLLRDGNVIRILKGEEKGKFDTELSHLSRFFACAASCHIAGANGHPMSAKPQQLFDKDGSILETYESWITEEETRLTEVYKTTYDDPLRFIHGKSLLSLFTRHLSHASRSSKFSGANLLEIGALARGSYMQSIEKQVLGYFRSIGSAPQPTAP